MRNFLVAGGTAVFLAVAVFFAGFAVFGRPAPKPVSKGALEELVSRSLASPAPATSAQTPEEACRSEQQAHGVVQADGPCLDLDKIVSGLKLGNYSHNLPDKGVVGERFPVSLILETDENQNATSTLQGKVSTEPARWSRMLVATLSGPDLQVEPKEAQRRLATSTAPVRWDWLVEAEREGATTAKIEVLAEIMVAGQAMPPLSIKVFEAPMKIRVTAFQQVEAFLGTTSGMATAVASFLTALSGAMVMRKGYPYLGL